MSRHVDHVFDKAQADLYAAFELNEPLKGEPGPDFPKWPKSVLDGIRAGQDAAFLRKLKSCLPEKIPSEEMTRKNYTDGRKNNRRVTEKPLEEKAVIRRSDAPETKLSIEEYIAVLRTAKRQVAEERREAFEARIAAKKHPTDIETLRTARETNCVLICEYTHSGLCVGGRCHKYDRYWGKK